MPKKFSIDKLNSSQLVDMKGLKNNLSQEYQDFEGSINLASFIENTKRTYDYVVKTNSDLISHGKITQSDLDEEDIDEIKNAEIKTFTSKLALLKTAKEEYGKRTFWDKFFHPFRTYSENKAIGNLENEIRDKYDVGENILTCCDSILDNSYNYTLYDKSIDNNYGLISNSALEGMANFEKLEKENELKEIEDSIKDANLQYQKDSKELSKLNKDIHGQDGIDYGALGKDVNGVDNTKLSEPIQTNDIKPIEIDSPSKNN